MKSENQLVHVAWADHLRVFATISVVFLHASADSLGLFGKIPLSYWWIGNFYDSAVRCSVPLFLMLTGVLMLPVEYDLKDFFKKRFMRIVLPLVFWSFAYIGFAFLLKVSHGEDLRLGECIEYIVHSLVFGSSFHFWYVYMILGIYVFIPIIGIYVRKLNTKSIFIFLCVWLVVLFINQVLSRNSLSYLHYFPGYLGYIILGYYLSIKEFKNLKNIRLISFFLIFVGVLITAFGTYYSTIQNNHFTERYYNYLSLNVLMVSVGVFLLFKNRGKMDLKDSFTVTFINKHSYGIYLIHILILAILSKPGIQWSFIHPAVGPFITTSLCLVISSLIVYAVSKLPYGKYISG
jgi:surface polysaccharide O-acyltransferase-like enzyme